MKTAAHPFGTFLDDLMTSHDLTQAELAGSLGYSQGWIAHVRTGHKPPSLGMAPRIKDRFPEVDEYEVSLLIQDARERMGYLRGYLTPALAAA